MKNTLIFLLLFTCSIHSQIPEKLFEGKIKKGISKVDKFLEPFGKNTYVQYDSFFESYNISSINSDGQRFFMKFIKSKTAGSVFGRLRGIYEYKGVQYDMKTEFNEELNEYKIIFTQRHEDTPLRIVIYELKEKQ